MIAYVLSQLSRTLRETLTLAQALPQVSVNCTQIVTALTVSAGGTTVTGAPTALAAANEFFTMRFDAATNAWYRVG